MRFIKIMLPIALILPSLLNQISNQIIQLNEPVMAEVITIDNLYEDKPQVIVICDVKISNDEQNCEIWEEQRIMEKDRQNDLDYKY